MTGPRIQYARTADGVNIAFFSIGEGLPVLQVPPIPWSHIGKEWEDPDYQTWFEANSRTRRLIRYDCRGTGLSDPIEDVPTLDELILDIDAILDKLGLDRVAVLGTAPGAAAAMAYVTRRPERVSHFLAWCPYARASDANNPQWQALLVMREADWNMFIETAAHAMVAGWDNPEAARRYAEIMRASVAPGAPAARIMDAVTWEEDADPAAVQCPALIIARASEVFSMESARYLASRIPDAELVVTDGPSLLPWVGDMDMVIRSIDAFLGLGRDSQAAAKPLASGMVTILFTDIEGSTGLTQSLGDAAAQEIVRAHNDIVREAIQSGGGNEIKHTGDGIMASFPLASGAIEAAVAIQRRVSSHSDAHPAAAFRVRVGLNAGEPVAEESDLFGTSVQLAARVCAQAEGGTALVTDVVRQLAAGKGFLFADAGEVVLKGFEDPVRLYEVRVPASDA